MPRKTHKRQRKQHGGLGYDYISSKTEILRKIVGLDDEVIKSDNIEYLITKDGFENSMKGSLFGFITPATETIRTQLIEYITVLYTIIVGVKGGPALTTYFQQNLLFPNQTDWSAREIEFGKIRGTVLVEDGKPQNLDKTGWFQRFIDNYKLATDLYESVRSNEEQSELIEREKVMEADDDSLPGIAVVNDNVDYKPTSNPEGNKTDTATPRDQLNTNSPYNSIFGGKRKQKSNRRKSNRRKSNRRKSNRR